MDGWQPIETSRQGSLSPRALSILSPSIHPSIHPSKPPLLPCSPTPSLPHLSLNLPFQLSFFYRSISFVTVSLKHPHRRANDALFWILSLEAPASRMKYRKVKQKSRIGRRHWKRGAGPTGSDRLWCRPDWQRQALAPARLAAWRRPDANNASINPESAETGPQEKRMSKNYMYGPARRGL